jgi:hypothetical protein
VQQGKKELQLVHNDVFGPVSDPSLVKSVYYVSFIDCYCTIFTFIKGKVNVKKIGIT